MIYARDELEAAACNDETLRADAQFGSNSSESVLLYKVCWKYRWQKSMLRASRYLDAWKAGDYLSSFDYLHRYFDYSMQSRDRTFYQYALLNLAILQADFGCFSEAVAAMQETVSTARENKDVACLNYSLSWLFHFGKAHPGELSSVQQTGVLGTDKEALSFLKAKAKDAGMWSLLSTTLLAEARQHQLSVRLECGLRNVLTGNRVKAKLQPLRALPNPLK